MTKFGNCPQCHKRFPIRAGRVEPHVRAGTRMPCKAPDWYSPQAKSNLPATERTVVEKQERQRLKDWRSTWPGGGMATNTR